MGFFSDLMGRSSARAAEQLGQRNAQRIDQGYGEANAAARTGYDTAQGRFQPYAEQGQRGYTAYNDAIGINGRDAQNAQFQNFTNDAFQNYQRDAGEPAINAMLRKYNARGQGQGGTASLALARAHNDSAGARVNNWLAQRQGVGQQGLGIAGTMAGLDQSYYGGMGDRAIARTGALNQNDIQATQAASNARMAGVNNLLRGLGTLGGTAISAFAPGAGGASAAGNIMGMFSPKGGGLSPGMIQVLASRGGGGGMPDGGYSPDPRRPWA